ncbi:MAG: hypothetical protein ISR95_05875 [Candidatus Marinimicrobia bacterium]|nr:hypothetical protein [Candidatus Neomarinimicrobiota bacterium]
MRLLTSYIVEDSLLLLAVPTLRFGRQAYIRACPVVKNERIGVIRGFWSALIR